MVFSLIFTHRHLIPYPDKNKSASGYCVEIFNSSDGWMDQITNKKIISETG